MIKNPRFEVDLRIGMNERLIIIIVRVKKKRH